MPGITLSVPASLEAVGVVWRSLQAQVDASFFQGWNWVGCLAARRFPDPVLLQAHIEGALVGLALFNRRRNLPGPDVLWLGESGAAQLDAVFVEHNGVLGGTGYLGACLHAATRAPIDGRVSRFGRRLVLSGVDAAHLAAATGPGMVRHHHVARVAPFVDLDRLRATSTGYLESLSANTRYQIRRSTRRYEEVGPVTLRRAGSVAEALDFLDGLAVLHQASWTSRGRPGAFANEAFRAFHQALIGRAFADGEIDLLLVAAGSQTVGYLYNFRFRGRVHAYQSGFVYGDDPHCKPGLTCHHLAIEYYAAAGMAQYDFLAGEDRYKTSLANASTTLHWAEFSPWWSGRAIQGAVGTAMRGWRARIEN